MTAPRIHFHLVANAHLDPVWLWDWREGLNEALNTTRVMVDLLREDPDLTVIRGEAALYEFIEREDPALFAEIQAHVRAGRWEPVGGTYVQADHNLPSTAVLLRQYAVGQAYFASRFGRRTRVAWAPDAFGHSAGLPEIMAAGGIRYFAHCRPFAKDLPLSCHTYWWHGAGGARLLVHRSPVDWYCHERYSLPARLDAYLAAARTSPLRHMPVLWGLGDHGGGPTRRALRDLRAWREAHPEVVVEHSGLERYFLAVEAELAAAPSLRLPEVHGELGYSLRGCFAATSKIKHAYRRCEQQFLRAMRVRSLATRAGAAPPSVDLAAAERTLLFNAFHDILPGSSIERAYDEQIAQLGGAGHAAQAAEFFAANALARIVDTTVSPPGDDSPAAVPFLVLNPHEFPVAAPVELETQLDWRPIAGYEGERTALVPIEVLDADLAPLPFQRLATENRAMTHCVWRVRVYFRLMLPPGGWRVVTVGYREKPRLAVSSSAAVQASADRIGNATFSLHAAVGAATVTITGRDGRPWLGAPGLQVKVFDDPYGAWGGMLEEPASWHLTAIRETWTITAVTLLESGPLLARLWVRFAGARSRVDFTFTVTAAEPTLQIAARIFIDDRSARVKLCLPGFDTATFEVPGGECTRCDAGEYAGIGYVRASGSAGRLGIATDVHYGFSLGDQTLGITLARASRYADDLPTPAETLPHLPAVDSGELRSRLLLTPDVETTAVHARLLHQPVLTQSVPPTPGRLPRAGAAAWPAGWPIVDVIETGPIRQQPAGDGRPGQILNP